MGLATQHGQMVAMALSSATYAVPGVVWHRFGYTKLGYWMYLVALCSILGDAVVRTDLARVVDRCGFSKMFLCDL